MSKPKAIDYLKHPVTYVKAAVGALLAAGFTLASAMADGDSFVQVEDGEWLTVVLAFLGSFAAVFGVSNGGFTPPTLDKPGDRKL